MIDLFQTQMFDDTYKIEHKTQVLWENGTDSGHLIMIINKI